MRLQDTISLPSSLFYWQQKPDFIVLIHSFYIFIFSNVLYIIIFYFILKYIDTSIRKFEWSYSKIKKKRRIETLIASSKNETMNRFIKVDKKNDLKNVGGLTIS